MDVSVVVPTYREAPNLPVLVEAVRDGLAATGADYEIVVVDDDSRDGSEQVCAELAADPSVRAVVLTSDVEGIFMAGADLKEFESRDRSPAGLAAHLGGHRRGAEDGART